MAEDRNSYGSILKSIGLFGGTKFFQILIGVLRNKIVALLLGPTGMGITGMITSTTEMVNSFTGLGLQTTSVRDIAKAHQTGDNLSVNRINTVVKKLVYFTGLLGTLIVLLFAKSFSILSFGNEEYTSAFRLVSIVILINQICIGQTALLQGTFHYREIAKASVFSSLLTLFACVPMYYFWGFDAIVPVIIITAFFSLLFSWYYSNKLNYQSQKISFREFLNSGKTMIAMGISLSVTSALSTGITYIQRLYISNYGNLADVGIYTAGILVATQYINVILTAMGSDYAPRLAAVSDDNDTFIDVVNRQMRLLLSIITPLLLPFIVFVKYLVLLLYSSEFLEVVSMLEWMMLGMFFKTISWSMSYTIVAKGYAKSFMINESLSQIYSCVLFLLGYRYGGFSGMGIAYCLTYVIYSIHMYIVCKKLFGYKIDGNVFKKIFIYMVPLIVFFLGVQYFKFSIWRYIIGSIGIVVVFFIAYKDLSEVISINQVCTFVKSKIKIKSH